MIVNWQSLIANLAVVALFITSWVGMQFVFNGRSRILRDATFGLVMGLGGMSSMLLAIQVSGTLLDLRLAMIGIAAFFGGPVGALVALAPTLAYRVIFGGPGVMAGAGSIVAVAAAALAVSYFGRRAKVPAAICAVVLALAVPAVNFAVFLSAGRPIVPDALIPMMTMNALTTLLAALFIMRHRVSERERELLRSAFLQSPDFQYVKTVESRYAAANLLMAQSNGFDTPAAMIGKCETDLDDTERARDLMAIEREIMATGRALTDYEEMKPDRAGREAWYSTSKVALLNAEGETIGIAGVTRDITARKRLEREVVESRNQLRYVLAEMSDGIAMFDHDGVLVYCNEQYRRLFPLTAHVRLPGVHLREILTRVVEEAEQIVPAGEAAAWVEATTTALQQESDEEIQLYDGRWLLVRTRPTSEGSALVVVSDMTKVKQAESTLRSMAEQLTLLATTDGLTGLTNRRAFDTALDAELARVSRTATPLSLLMIDVDAFKLFNDLYGHQAGDEALKAVGFCLQEVMRRPADLAARYGGEEFVAILPDTDEEGACFIAEAFRRHVHALALRHKGTEKGVLSVSVGIATCTPDASGMTAAELIRRADAALYNAKGSGRDRISYWRARQDVRARDEARV